MLTKSALEDLLRSKNLGSTLFTSNYNDDSVKIKVAPTGIDALDAELDGGLPRGQLSEIVGARSTGRMSTLCAVLAAATGRGELVAFVDTLDAFDPGSAAVAGIDLSRLLWIRGCPGGRDKRTMRALDRALKAFGLLLHAGGFGVIALDLSDLADCALRRIPFTTWMRVPRAIEGQPTVCVLVGDRPIARSAGGVTLRLQPAGDAVRWSGAAGHGGLLLGLEVAVHVTGARRPHGNRSCQLFISTDAVHPSLSSSA